ncbi:hypothetical protein CH289_07640 [Rhodococcus sp. RS1C4]|nr:hypothetical protein [Rhodococcus sp. RS1C4]OZC55058.1 hypothetical protein CH289_07640 [Rhodococcus sp. RS1C4]
MRDLREISDPDLHLPIGGKRYTIPAPNGREGLRLWKLARSSDLTSDQEVEEIRKILKPVLREMHKDGLSWPFILHAGRTAIIHFAISPKTAVAHWENGEAAQYLGSVPMHRIIHALAKGNGINIGGARAE